MQVLISEVGGRKRWTQFTLKLEWVPLFFGESPEDLSNVKLSLLKENGDIDKIYSQRAGLKKRSRNWWFEIPEARGLKHPGRGQRPILVLADRDDGTKSFALIMPSDKPYPEVSSYLAKNRKTPGNELARCIVSRTVLPAGNFGLVI